MAAVRFWRELRRRHVLRVAAGDAVVGCRRLAPANDGGSDRVACAAPMTSLVHAGVGDCATAIAARHPLGVDDDPRFGEPTGRPLAEAKVPPP